MPDLFARDFVSMCARRVPNETPFAMTIEQHDERAFGSKIDPHVRDRVGEIRARENLREIDRIFVCDRRFDARILDALSNERIERLVLCGRDDDVDAIVRACRPYE
jgi:hypothetical protein